MVAMADALQTGEWALWLRQTRPSICVRLATGHTGIGKGFLFFRQYNTVQDVMSSSSGCFLTCILVPDSLYLTRVMHRFTW